MFLLQLIVAFAIDPPPRVSLPRVLLPENEVSDTASPSPKLSLTVVIIIVLLTVVFFLSGLLHILARCLIRYTQIRRSDSDEQASAIVLQGQLQHLFSLHDRGVDQAFIDALPLFFYKSVRGLKDPVDCAVCLSEFQGDDRLRLLPICSHAFHIDCIDTWLLSHSTCPLCRRSLLPDPAGADAISAPAQVLQLDADQHPSNLSEAFVRSRAASEAGDGEGELESAEIQTILMPSYEDEAGVAPMKTMSVRLGRFRAVETGSHGRLEQSASGRRSYSLGSYEYVIDPSSLEVMIAPTPAHRRWANCKPPTPGHKNALSDLTPDHHSCSLEEPSSAAFSEELSRHPHTLASCFCPHDPSAYSKHRPARAGAYGDGDRCGGRLKQCNCGSLPDIRVCHSADTIVGVPCSARMSIERDGSNTIQGGGTGSQRYLLAKRTFQWLMGRE